MTACTEDHDAIWQEGYVEGYADGTLDRDPKAVRRDGWGFTIPEPLSVDSGKDSTA